MITKMSYDEKYMKIALEEAKKNKNFVPIGAVVVLPNGQHFAASNNNKHAEIILLDNLDCDEAVFYVTVEPCIMCLAAMSLKRVERVYFGARNEKFGACGGKINLLPYLNWKIDIYGGFLGHECAKIMEEFFKSKR